MRFSKRDLASRLACGLAAASVVSVAACGSPATPATGSGNGLSGAINGAGASTQQAAARAWIVEFVAANPGATVNYDPTGSGAGRTQFVAGGVDFAGSDVPISGDELATARDRCGGEVVEVPDYVSPIAVVYNLPQVPDLKLSPPALARIFAGDITTWNDPAITADNPGTALPTTRIAPVHRADKSGTTENFTDYLRSAAPSEWSYEASDNWPLNSGEAAQGTSGVVGAVKVGEGTIGYADASQAVDLGVAQIKVGDEYVGPTAEAAAKVLDNSTRIETDGQHAFAYDLDRNTSASGTYPITLVSYAIACGAYDDPGKAELVRTYLDYVISAEGQAAAARAAGSAPITDDLRAKIQPAVDSIGAQP